LALEVILGGVGVGVGLELELEESFFLLLEYTIILCLFLL